MSIPNSMKNSVLVVGGGIAGMVAALRAARLGRAVTLLERQPHLGGLLGSVTVPGCEYAFDHGTHIPVETGNATLDAELFECCRADEWLNFPRLRAGNYWNGRFNGNSPCLDLRSLPLPRYEAIVRELTRESPLPVEEYANAALRLGSIYGSAMCETVFEPVLKKFTGRTLRELAPEANELFGLSRFICVDPSATRELKKNPVLDRRLAFHSWRESPHGAKICRAYYPRTGGVGRWIEGLGRRLASAGVRIVTNATLRALDPNGGQAGLADGTTLSFDQLEWSLPAAQLLRVAGSPTSQRLAPPAFSAIDLYHFVCDRVPTTDVFYATCHDPALRTFRVTFYSNLQAAAHGAIRFTVEVIRAASEPLTDPGVLFAELKQMGLYSGEARATVVHTETMAAGFPILTTGFAETAKCAALAAVAEFPRVRLLGRAGGQAFFMRDVLLDAWRDSETSAKVGRLAA